MATRDFVRIMWVASLLSGPAIARASDFTYFPPGNLIGGSGADGGSRGLSDCTNRAPGILFPLSVPAYANSQLWNPGGVKYGSGDHCDPANYDFPWRDNFCEDRTGFGNTSISECANGTDPDHAGQDIRPSTCIGEQHPVFAVDDGKITHLSVPPTTNNSWVNLTAGGKVYSYLHMDPIYVSLNQVVSRGQVIGRVSDSSIGPTSLHLHFEVADTTGTRSPYIALVDSYRRETNPIFWGSSVISAQILRVHEQPGSASFTLIDVGLTGTVLGGPTVATFFGDCYIYWLVLWDTGEIGWSADNYLLVPQQCGPAASGHSQPEGCVSGAPTAVTRAASGTTQSSATLNMSVNPNGSATTVRFDWGPNSNVSQSTPSQEVGGGSSTIPASVTLGGLSCGTTYFFRARAENALGSAPPGNTFQFSTAACGCGGSQSSNLIQNGTFAADGSFWTLLNDFYADDRFNNFHNGPGYAYLSNPDGSPGNGLNGELYQQVTIPSDATAATLKFWTRISTSEPVGGPADDFLNVTLKNSSGAFLAPLGIYTNQDASSSYVERTFNLASQIGKTIRLHFLGLTNSDGQPTVFRVDDVSLEVVRPAGSAPEVTTQAADQITATSARLNMMVDPNSGPTSIWFNLDADDSTPSTDTEHIGIGCGSQAIPASIGVFGLECNTHYYFEAVAENSKGDDDGIPLQFNTLSCGTGGSSPHADTDPATGVGPTSATLNADVDANGVSTQAWFAWGTSAALGQETPHRSIGSGTVPVEFEEDLSGLACGTTYYFRNHASNSAGSDSGVVLSFDTHSCDEPPTPSDLLLFASREGCAGPEPAVVLGWTMSEAAAGSAVTIRDEKGQVVGIVDTQITGPVLAVPTGLEFGTLAKFRAETIVNGSLVQSNEVVVPIASDECRVGPLASEVPLRPLIWAERPYCESGVAKVRLRWTKAPGATEYTLQRTGFDTPSATYNGLTGTTFIDSGLSPGGVPTYQLIAHNSNGGTGTFAVGLVIPGTICDTTGAPGHFSGQLTSLVCEEGDGKASLVWSQSNGAVADYRVFEAENHFFYRADDNEEDFAKFLTHLTPGAVARAVVQSESASASGEYREIDEEVATLVPIDICGASAMPPSIGNVRAQSVCSNRAVLRANITANGSDTAARFEWGKTTSYDQETVSRPAGNAFTSVPLGEVLTELTADSTYHFRAIAVSGNGTTYSDDAILETSSVPCSDSGDGIFADGFENGVICTWSDVSGWGGSCVDPNTHSAVFDPALEQSFVISDDEQQGLDISSALTLELWVKPAAAPGNYQLVGKFEEKVQEQSYGLQYLFDNSELTISFVVANGQAVSYLNWPVDLGTGQWRHLAVVYSGASGTGELFVDGVSEGTKSGSAILIGDSAAAFTIGQRESARYFNGNIDEVRVWASARTASEIATDRAIEIPCSELGLRGYWKMDGNGEDCTTNSNHLTALNGVSYAADVPFQ